MKLHTPPRSLATYTKATIGAAVATSAAGTADAAIVFFDVSPDKTINAGEGMTFGSINLGTGTYVFGNFTDPDFTLRFTGPGTSLYNGGGGGIVQWGVGALGYVLNLSYGSTINPGAITSWGTSYDYLARGSSGYWVGGANAYAPLRINQGGGNYNYGWVAINYDTSGPTATISGFAFEDQLNTVILAGDQGGPAPVPEPGTMAVGAGLFALAVGAHLRRRREKKAAAPDALLNLAAGARGVEKFRADKAA